MARSSDLAELFRHPTSAAQRRYEICRAYFLEEATAAQIAQRLQLHPDSVRAIVRDFANDPDIEQLFNHSRPGPRDAPTRDAFRQEVLDLRHQGYSLGDIQARLDTSDHPISESSVYRILNQAGLAGDGVRTHSLPLNQQALDGSDIAPVADVRVLDLQPGQRFHTAVAGLFLFVPLLLKLDIVNAVRQAAWPGSLAIPPLQAILALLTIKLLGQRRVSHIDDLCFDQGAGLFCGLNVLPKATFATDYSYRTERAMSDCFVKALLAKSSLLEGPSSFNLDFHAVPYRGENVDLEKHWLAKQNRSQTSIMIFVAQHRLCRVMCYATANVLRDDMDAMAVRFVDDCKRRTGTYPELVVFDSKVTTYSQLAELEDREVGFITIRKRGPKMLERVATLASSNWKNCQIRQAKGQREISYVDEQVKLDGCPKPMRQVVVKGLGREDPTFFVTNDRPKKLTARDMVQDYAQRNLIENGLGEDITFFHMDSLSSGVRLNVDFELTLTMTADLLYREMASLLKGFEEASPQTVYRRFIDTIGTVEVEKDLLRVRLNKRAHNPLITDRSLKRKLLYEKRRDSPLH